MNLIGKGFVDIGAGIKTSCTCCEPWIYYRVLLTGLYKESGFFSEPVEINRSDM